MWPLACGTWVNNILRCSLEVYLLIKLKALSPPDDVPYASEVVVIAIGKACMHVSL